LSIWPSPSRCLPSRNS